MTTVDLRFDYICHAVYYTAAFALTFGEDKHRINTERARRRLLQRHMIDRGRVENYR